MRKIIGLVGLIGVISACSNSIGTCEICGDYNLLNFSKVEVNQLNTTLNDFTFRRNLYVNQNIGTDQYSICSWNSEKPNNSWSRSQQKEIKVLNGNLKISQNGTWFWNISTRETIRSTNFNKIQKITKINETIEEGTWKYISQTHLEFKKVNKQNRTQKTTEVRGKCSRSIIIYNEMLPTAENKAYLFEIEFDSEQDKIGLKTCGNSPSSMAYNPEKSVFSLMGGSVWMTMSRASQPNQIAHRLVRSK